MLKQSSGKKSLDARTLQQHEGVDSQGQTQGSVGAGQGGSHVDEGLALPLLDAVRRLEVEPGHCAGDNGPDHGNDEVENGDFGSLSSSCSPRSCAFSRNEKGHDSQQGYHQNSPECTESSVDFGKERERAEIAFVFGVWLPLQGSPGVGCTHVSLVIIAQRPDSQELVSLAMTSSTDSSKVPPFSVTIHPLPSRSLSE